MEQESDRSKALFTEAWAWREQLQRAMDGCHSTDDMSASSLAHYEEFEGPNIPLPSGYQVPCFWPLYWQNGRILHPKLRIPRAQTIMFDRLG